MLLPKRDFYYNSGYKTCKVEHYDHSNTVPAHSVFPAYPTLLYDTYVSFEGYDPGGGYEVLTIYNFDRADIAKFEASYNDDIYIRDIGYDYAAARVLSSMNFRTYMYNFNNNTWTTQDGTGLQITIDWSAWDGGYIIKGYANYPEINQHKYNIGRPMDDFIIRQLGYWVGNEPYYRDSNSWK